MEKQPEKGVHGIKNKALFLDEDKSIHPSFNKSLNKKAPIDEEK